MNQKIRRQIEELYEQLVEMQEKLSSTGNVLGELRDAEQEKFNNLSEGLQASDNGQKIEQAAACLDTATDAVESAESSLGDAIEALRDTEQ